MKNITPEEVLEKHTGQLYVSKDQFVQEDVWRILAAMDDYAIRLNLGYYEELKDACANLINHHRDTGLIESDIFKIEYVLNRHMGHIFDRNDRGKLFCKRCMIDYHERFMQKCIVDEKERGKQ